MFVGWLAVLAFAPLLFPRHPLPCLPGWPTLLAPLRGSRERAVTGKESPMAARPALGHAWHHIQTQGEAQHGMARHTQQQTTSLRSRQQCPFCSLCGGFDRKGDNHSVYLSQCIFLYYYIILGYTPLQNWLVTALIATRWLFTLNVCGIGKLYIYTYNKVYHIFGNLAYLKCSKLKNGLYRTNWFFHQDELNIYTVSHFWLLTEPLPG